MNRVAIIAAKRSAIGNFGGTLSEVSASELGTTVVRQMMESIPLSSDLIDEVIVGNILNAGMGQNIARQIALNSDLPDKVSAMTINKVCGSGLKSVILAAQSIMLGDNDIVIAGGTENMSQAPFVAENMRWGKRMGNSHMIDTLLSDGLTDDFEDKHMGITAENIAETYHYSREDQDKLAMLSQQRAKVAIQSGRFKDEIVPVMVPQRKGDVVIFEEDEYPRFDITLDKLHRLKPAFTKNGTVTAGNASGINDGAAFVILMSEQKALQLNIKPLAFIKSYASCGVQPSLMGLGPIPATKKALEKAQMTTEDIDLIEINEAFAVQTLKVIDDLKLNKESVNVNGGAIALGHPIGASGARILVSLIHEMIKRDAKTGLATLCIGGGQGISLIIER